jgi:NADH-quinone oxidoreductase subunit N
MDLAKIAAAGASGDIFFKVGLALAMVGYAFKLALVPFHAWAPDVYQGAPTPVTAFMSVGTKAAAFAALARFLVTIVPAQQVQQYFLPLAVAAAFSMILGGSVAIWQQDLKRLMAYSGIAHAGYLMMALPGLSKDGMGAGAFYMTSYLFISMGVFGVISYLEAEGVEGSSVKGFTGLWYRKKWLALALTVCMFALIGLPPTSGFFGKLMLAVAALEGGGTIAWTVLVALIVSTGISAYAYLRVIGALFKKNEGEVPAIAKVEELTLAPSVTKFAIAAVVVIGVVGTLVLGIAPGLVQGLFGI